MPRKRFVRLAAQSSLARYAAAALAVGTAVLVRRGLDPFLGESFPYATMFLAVLGAAGYGGLGPGLFATGLGGLLAARFLVPPRDSFAIVETENWAGFLLYLAIGCGIAVLGGRLHQIHAGLRAALAEARRAEASRRHLVAIVESSDDAIYSKDLNGLVTSWNAAAERLFGWTAAEVVGRPFTLLVPPDRVAEATDRTARS